MVWGRGRTLGLALEEGAILAVEIRQSARGATLERRGEFAVPQDLSIESPERLGEALREFLRHSRFSARAAVIGLPARWMLLKEARIGPADASVRAGVAHIEAERAFATEFDQLAIDYTVGEDSSRSMELLLAAIMRRRLDQVAAMSRAAGLKVRAVSSTSLALAEVARVGETASLSVFLRPLHSELVICSGGGFAGLRHMPLPQFPRGAEDNAAREEWKRSLASAVARVAGLMPRDEGAATDAVVIWDGIGLGGDAVADLGGDLGVPVRATGGLSEIGLGESDDRGTDGRFAGAAALALAGACGDMLPIDFLHSRLEVRGKRKLGRAMFWAVAAAASVLVAAGVYFAGYRSDERALAELRERLESMSDDIDAADELVQQAALALGWTDERVRFLEPLRELTLAFPETGRIWITSLAVREDMRMVASGKSASERTVLELLDRIRERGAFDAVKLVFVRGAGGGSRDVAFSITFTYKSGE